MAWNPTNANDVTLIVSRVERDDSGSRTGTTELANTGAIVVDDFSIDTEEDLEGLSGLGNRTPQGISKGDVDHNFSFTVQGEDAELFQQISEDDSGSEESGRASVELEIIARFQDINIVLSGAWAGTRSVSGSSGDPIEYEAEGMATNKDTVETV
jgi:hypothetical protein